MADMNMARQNHSAIVQGDRLYVFGGRQNDSLLASIEFLELEGGTNWTTVTENESVERMSATIFECGPKKIAVFGGLKVAELKGKDYASDGYIFDTDSQEFRVIYGDRDSLRFKSHTQAVKVGSNYATVGVVEEATFATEDRETIPSANKQSKFVVNKSAQLLQFDGNRLSNLAISAPKSLSVI